MREKTNSVTRLVKIIAEEVSREVVREELLNLKVQPPCEKFCGAIKSNLGNAWAAWTISEEELLLKEVQIAIKQIAKNHCRSEAAIWKRIRSIYESEKT